MFKIKPKFLIFFASSSLFLFLSAPTKANTWEYHVEIIAKTIYGEARGVKKQDGTVNKAQQAAVGWCILNRFDEGYGTIEEIAKSGFVGYSAYHPIWPELKELANDVLTRWQKEQDGEDNIGRVLPKDYLWFTGDGDNNWFRNDFHSKTYWDWSLPDPYE